MDTSDKMRWIVGLASNTREMLRGVFLNFGKRYVLGADGYVAGYVKMDDSKGAALPLATGAQITVDPEAIKRMEEFTPTGERIVSVLVNPQLLLRALEGFGDSNGMVLEIYHAKRGNVDGRAIGLSYFNTAALVMCMEGDTEKAAWRPWLPDAKPEPKIEVT